MRLWTLHPRYLDRSGLIAAWREGLLAQAVVGRQSGGYAHHPQLTRFRQTADPGAALGCYLAGVADEADVRGYRFRRSLIVTATPQVRMAATTGQRDLEWAHLKAKLAARSPAILQRWESVTEPDLHPMFELVNGLVAAWERLAR